MLCCEKGNQMRKVTDNNAGSDSFSIVDCITSISAVEFNLTRAALDRPINPIS